MIVFDNVRKTYPTRNGRRTVVLNGFSGTLNKGTNVGILGRNGAGKSTLMRLISGGEQPDSGIIHREGRISWPLGFSGGFHGRMTGNQNVRFISQIYRADFDKVLRFVNDFAELGKFMEMPMRRYSAGMRARLAFGVSMAIEFEYYLIDEVIAVGDRSFQKRCREVFAERRKSATILLVSHNSKLLRNFCDVGGVLSDGELIFYNTLEEAIEIHNTKQEERSGL
ncbi:MAG: ABC transporter ATP-binding protein [Pseudomonadota bacterium]